MRLIQQSTVIENINLDGVQINIIKIHGDLLPNNVLAIVCGRSNCGKTNAVINLILSINGLKFKNIYIFSKSLGQSKYQLLKKIIKVLKFIGFFTFSNNADVTALEKAKPFSVFIFDDVSCEKQNTIRDYYSRGRHKWINSFYLAQTYTKIPKQLIRDNANFLMIFPQDNRNLKHIYDEHVNSDMSYKEFLKMCRLCWQEKHNFLTIAKDYPLSNGRYRNGFSKYFEIQPEEECFIEKQQDKPVKRTEMSGEPKAKKLKRL